MDEKTFEFLEKMYAEMQNGFKRVDDRLTKIETTIENDIKPGINLALQGYVDTNEKLSTIEAKIDKMSETIERHDIKIQVIQGGKISNG